MAKDYQASSAAIWPNYFISNLNIENESELKKIKFKSYFNYTLFYLGPFVTTAVFSVMLYSRIVYLVKRILRVKSFYTINIVKLISKILFMFL